jgi:prepilin-type N-terminal cleavage/methylation domain-containing protein
MSGLLQSRKMAAGSRVLRAAGAGFSLVEVIVVIVIIGVIAGLVLPRLTGTAARRAGVDAQAVADLLTSAAQRALVSRQPLVLTYEPAADTLTLQTVSLTEGDEGASVGGTLWKRAPLTNPVVLAGIDIIAVQADGQRFDPSGQFRIAFSPAQSRPSVSMLVHTSAGLGGEKRAWQIDLPTLAASATLRSVGVDQLIAPAETGSVDLDASGRRSTAW